MSTDTGTLPVDVPTPRKKYNDPKATESEMLDILERHYAKTGNGGAGEYAFLRQVRNAAGFDAKRTFDAVVVGLWPSRGHDIHVIEVKVSRSDWQRELAKPDKAEDAAKVADRFSVAAPRGVVDVNELPATWGYIEVQGGVEEFTEHPPIYEGGEPYKVRSVTGRKVRVIRAAPLLRAREECIGPIPRTFLVPLLRAAGAVPDVVPHQDQVIRAAVDKAVAEARQEWNAKRDGDFASYQAAAQELATFKRRAGLYWMDEAGMVESAKRIRLMQRTADSPTLIMEELRRLHDHVGRVVADLSTSIDALAELPSDAG